MTYTHGHHESVLRSHRWRSAANSAGYLLDQLRPGDTLLDVGCGPGTITRDLAARVAPGRVAAVDASAEVLAEARTVPGNVEWRVADVYDLPWPDGHFDVVHAHQVLQHLTDPVAALREMRRVCRPGGLVAARDADYAAMTWYPEVPELTEWQTLYRRVGRANGGEPDAGRRLLSWARATGLTDVTASASVWCFTTPEERTWWSGLWADRTLRSAVATSALDRGVATLEGLERLAAGWRRWGSDPDAWFGVLHGEILCRV